MLTRKCNFCSYWPHVSSYFPQTQNQLQLPPPTKHLSVTSIAILKHNDWVVNIQTSSSIRYAVRLLSKTQ